MNNKFALAPEYMKQFQCIGAECDDTCCAAWRITIDKTTYDKYQNVTAVKLVDQLRDSVTLMESDQRNELVYARMSLDPKLGTCTMLENGLCSIQAELGESYLSKTCATYPRRIHYVDELQEISTEISCPASARLALLNPSGIQFIEMDGVTGENLHMGRLKVRDIEANNIKAYFWNMRVAIINILQNRSFSVPHRLIIVGLLLERIQELVVRESFNEIDAEIEAYMQYYKSDTELADYNSFPSDNMFQLNFLNKLIIDFTDTYIAQPKYKECIEDYLSGMSMTNDPSAESILAHFEKSIQTYYKPFMKNNEYILENYLVNYVFSHLFPLSHDKNIFEEYIILVIHFSLIKLHLIGMSAHYQCLDSEIVVKLIQRFSKNYEHNSAYINHVYEAIKEKEYNYMGYMSLLIKN